MKEAAAQSGTALLACPLCRVNLLATQDDLECPSCHRRYPILEGGIVDFFLRDAPARAMEGFWDREAEADEVQAATALPKAQAGHIFPKIPPWLGRYSGELQNKVVLDLGCGYGRTLIYSARHGGPKVPVGIDVSHVMLRKARRYATEYGVDALLLRGEVGSLPFPSSSIDVVYSAAVLLHLPKEMVRRTIQEVARVLAPGGFAVFETSFLGWANPDGVQQRIVTALLSRWMSPAWVRTYSYSEVRRLLGRHFRKLTFFPAGYAVLPTTFLTRRVPDGFKRLAQSVNSRVSPRLHFRNFLVSGWSVRAEN